MSTFNEQDITCEECDEKFKGTVWTAIHAGEDPELKDLLLGGELNLVMCPHCSHVAYQDHFILYQDPAAELIAYIYPLPQKAEEDFLRKAMQESFQEAQKVYAPDQRKDYDPLLVFGLESFVEMMHQEELRAEQSQIAEALCKEHRIPYVVLRPSQARRLGTMRVLPGGTGNDLPQGKLLTGLKKLLTLNPALDLYAALLKTVESAPDWSL